MNIAIRTKILFFVCFASLCLTSIETQANENFIQLNSGIYKGQWIDRNFEGPLVVEVSVTAGTIEFINADETCLGKKTFPVESKGGMVLMPVKFNIDIGGKCGPAEIDAIKEGSQIIFTIFRTNYSKKYIFTGSINIGK